jgi:hypothetical protein
VLAGHPHRTGMGRSGIEVGEGVCIACGYERTYEDTVNDAMDRVMRDGC